MPFQQLIGYTIAGDAGKAAQTQMLMSVIDDRNISRDGYNQNDLVDNRTKNIKLKSSIYYRPLGNDKLEIV